VKKIDELAGNVKLLQEMVKLLQEIRLNEDLLLKI
jgi:hypothetical protein